jgi:hypothetical protein
MAGQRRKDTTSSLNQDAEYNAILQVLDSSDSHGIASVNIVTASQ